MADQGNNPTRQLIGMFDPPAGGAHPPTPDAAGQQAIAAIPANISGMGGGWSLSESQLRGILKRLDAIFHRLDTAARNSLPMIEVKPPAAEPHSQSVVEIMNNSGQFYRKSLESQIEYIDSLRKNIRDSLASSLGIDSNNSDLVARTDAESDGTL